MDISTILKDIANNYSIPEEELIAKYITQQQDIENLSVPKIKEIIHRFGGDTRGKRRKQEWVDAARSLMDNNTQAPVAEKQLLCEVRQFCGRRCALHGETGRLYSIDKPHAEIGMWDPDRGPIFFEEKMTT